MYLRPTPIAGTLTEFKLLCKTACDQQSDCSVAYVNWVDETKKCDLYGDHCKTNTVRAVTGHYIYIKGNYQNMNYKYRWHNSFYDGLNSEVGVHEPAIVFS